MSLPIRVKFVKLVRDRVPFFYPEMRVVWKATDPAERAVLLKGKLVEEVVEYLTSREPEELADILEIIGSLAHFAHDMSIRDLLEMAQRKREDRGGYRDAIGLYVEGVDQGDPRIDYDTVTR